MLLNPCWLSSPQDAASTAVVQVPFYQVCVRLFVFSVSFVWVQSTLRQEPSNGFCFVLFCFFWIRAQKRTVIITSLSLLSLSSLSIIGMRGPYDHKKARRGDYFGGRGRGGQPSHGRGRGGGFYSPRPPPLHQQGPYYGHSYNDRRVARPNGGNAMRPYGPGDGQQQERSPPQQQERSPPPRAPPPPPPPRTHQEEPVATNNKGGLEANEERVQALLQVIPEEKDLWKGLLFIDLSHQNWEEKEEKKKAVAATEAWLRQQLKFTEQHNGSSGDDDSEDDSDDPRVDMSRTTSDGQDALERRLVPYLQFLQALPSFAPLTATFFMLPALGKDLKCNYCPCSRKCGNWRKHEVWKKGDMERQEDEGCPCDFSMCSERKTSKFGPSEILEHLREKSKNQIDLYHCIALHYVEEFLKDFHGPGVGHRGLYTMGTKGYQTAVTAENTAIRSYIQLLDKEKERLEEKRRVLHKYSQLHKFS